MYGLFEFDLETTSSTTLISTPRLFFFSAEVPTTGTPRRSESSGRLISMFFSLASSIRFTQTTTFGVLSIVCKTRLRFLSKQVASQTTITASESPKQIKFRATSSSSECAISEYVPGISTITYEFFSVE